MERKDRSIKSVMHTLKKRALTVKSVQSLTPRLKRITFSGEELSDFESLSPDDHIKVFFEAPGEESPQMRDYTPRRFDRETRELDIEFYLHGDGPGSSWAREAVAGSKLTVGGPKGSRTVPYNFDGYLMIGDETALPTFARRLAELPAGSRSQVFIEVEDEAQKLQLESAAEFTVHWIYRHGQPAGDAQRFITELKNLAFAKEDYFTWIACEKSCAFEIEKVLINDHGAKKEFMKTAGYWNKGRDH